MRCLPLLMCQAVSYRLRPQTSSFRSLGYEFINSTVFDIFSLRLIESLKLVLFERHGNSARLQKKPQGNTRLLSASCNYSQTKAALAFLRICRMGWKKSRLRPNRQEHPHGLRTMQEISWIGGRVALGAAVLYQRPPTALADPCGNLPYSTTRT